MTYWTGGEDYTSRLNRSCAHPRYGCDCDINDYVSLENRELLTNKAEFPVILRFGDTGEAGDDERGYQTLETEVLWHKLSVASYACQTSSNERQSASKSKKSNVF